MVIPVTVAMIAKQRRKELVRLGVITLVGAWLRRRPPWGILSGVRPTKIFHHLRERGFSSAGDPGEINHPLWFGAPESG